MRLPTTRLSRTLLPTLVLSSVAALLAAPLMPNRRDAPMTPAANSQTQTSPERARETYGRIPLSFEANRGQTDTSVNFLARGAGYALFLKPTEAVFVLQNADLGLRSEDPSEHSLRTDALLKTDTPHSKPNPQSAIHNPQSKVLRMRLVGARASAHAEGGNELAGKSNYLIGNDSSKWRTNVSTYGRVRYAEVYPGVDVIYYGDQRQLEYDFRVAPGADARVVALEFEGADKVEVAAGGDLLLKVGGEIVRQPKPVIYQETAGARREVEGGYAVGRDGRVHFALGEYDPSLPLIIDPVIVYSTYLGGTAQDQANAVAVDSSGNTYLSGFTSSTNFPTANALQAANGAFQDAFVTKLNAAGTALVYSTYLGGNGGEQSRDLAIDSAGNVYITGFTNSTNFPTANAIQAALDPSGNGQDTFVTKLNASGNALVYSTYLGGNGGLEFGEGIAVDSAGNAYVTGNTNSTNFPTANAIQATLAGSVDAYLTKLNAAGTALVYSTYLGGSAGVASEIGRAVAVDSAGNAYVVGSTDATNFPTANPVQAANAGGSTDGFVTKVNAAGNALVYSTYLGGSAQDDVQAVAVDSAGNAYLTGVTNSTNFPTANALQPVNDASQGITQEAFVTKLNAAGTAFVYSTYLGGTGGEIGNDIAVDSAGNVYVAGGTGSFNSFPTANALQCQRLGGGGDPFVTKYNAAGTAYVYSTYYGGSGGSGEIARGVAADSAGNTYVAGNTQAVDFPVVNPVQGVFAGEAAVGDAFLFKLSDASAGPTSALQFTQTLVIVQENVASVTLTVQRTGDTSGAVTVDYGTSPPALRAASERSDHTTALGTLRFAAGETSKTIDLLINEDSFFEEPESLLVALSNPTGGATLSCSGAVATIEITDDTSEPSTNAIDDPTIFVGTHYHDFLNRQADSTGLSFWADQIIACGADAACIDRTRTSVSQAFFLSIEYKNTAFFVFRFYKATFHDSAPRPRGMPRYREFLRDQREVGQGVVVNQAGWEDVLEANKRAFTLRWVQRPEFLAEFPMGMGFDEYVAKLAANSGTTLTPVEINVAFESYSDTPQGRANALRAVLESGSVYNAQFNAGFVFSQYIGYLRRNPNDAPEPGLDYAGFDFWLTKLNSFSQPGEDVRDPATAQRRVERAEMVRAFILSTEYRGRFGQP